ncbi:MAG: DNA repair protein RecO [Proteobacteria bacterium]|jgi:DNA repair protein RecO (recombination protein O)|nr:DNA repair protein RecO [Pseudomonadota bacterium]
MPSTPDSASRHRVSLQLAYVLHTRPYRDTSQLLEIFSRKHGRIGLVARGVRSGKSRYAGQLQPFAPLLLSWNGQGELPTLAGAETAGVATALEYRTMLSGFYLNELLMRLLQRGDAHPLLFDAYVEALSALAAGQQETILRRFERILLQEMGYGLILDTDVENGEPIQDEVLYCYHPEQGPVRVVTGDEAGIRVHGRTLRAITADHYPDLQTRHEAKQLMRSALAVHLGGRPLKSRELYRQQNAVSKLHE